MPKSSSVSSSDETFGMFSSESESMGSGSRMIGDGDRIWGHQIGGGISKLIEMGIGMKGDGDRMAHGGEWLGVVVGDKSVGDGISISSGGEEF